MNASEKAVYINQIASSMGLSLDRLAPFARNLGQAKDKKEINIKLFKIIEELKMIKEVPVIIPKVKVKKKITTSISSIQTKLKKKIASLQTAAAKMELMQQEIFKLRQLIKDPNEEIDLTAQIKTIIAEGFWTNPKIQKGILYLTTKNNVICQDTKDVKLKKNLGSFKAAFNLSTGYLKVTGGNNRGLNQNMHPYINYAGHICWGGATTVAAKLASGFEIEKLFKLLSALLITHTGNGYSWLGEF